jgi:hypothetical protein
VRVNAGATEDLRGRLLGLLIRLGDRLDLQSQDFVHEFLDHNEQGLALETMADALSEAGAPITDDERSEMLAFVVEMDMGGRVESALALCPTRP